MRAANCMLTTTTPLHECSCCGTARADQKGLPNGSHGLECGGGLSSKCMCKSTLMFLHWKDKKGCQHFMVIQWTSIIDFRMHLEDDKVVQKDLLENH